MDLLKRGIKLVRDEKHNEEAKHDPKETVCSYSTPFQKHITEQDQEQTVTAVSASISKVINIILFLPTISTYSRQTGDNQERKSSNNVFKEMYNERSSVEVQWTVLGSPFYHAVFSDTCETLD